MVCKKYDAFGGPEKCLTKTKKLAKSRKYIRSTKYTHTYIFTYMHTYLDQQFYDGFYDVEALAVDPDESRYVSHVQMSLLVDQLVEDTGRCGTVRYGTQTAEPTQDHDGKPDRDHPLLVE